MRHVSRDRCRLRLWGAAVAFVLFAAVASADSTPPQLVNFSISPLTVDTSAGPASLTVSITALESNGAGNASITLSLQSSGATVISRQGLAITGGALTVPQFTTAGVYAISLTLSDNVSNTATFSAATLQSMGFPSAITVTESAFGSVTLSASTANIAASGGAGSLQVIASNSGFAWTGSSSAAWLTITSGSSGTGTGTLEYFASANNSSSQRSGVITVSGQTFTVIQAAALSSLNTLVDPLVFNYQIGGATPPAQTITAFSSGTPLNFTAAASSAGNWLFVSPANGVTSAVLSVFINPLGLAAGAYSGSVTVSSPASANGSETAAVTLTVSGGPAITATPGALAFSYQQGGATPLPQNISITAGSATGVTVSASSAGGWLAVNPAGGTTPATVTVSVATAGLAPGTYTGSVGIATSSGAQVIPVTLVVTTASALAVNPGSLTFTYTPGGALPAAQALSLSGPSTELSYTASASSSGNWLTLGAPSGAIPGALSVLANPAGLAPGQYPGSIVLTPAGGAAQSVTATLFVGSGQGFTVSSASLSFGVAPGALTAAPQTVTISPSGANFTYTATASTQDGSGWLVVTPSGPSTSGSLSVTLAPSQLAVGTHTGSISIVGQGSTQSLPVTVLVIPLIAATPASVTFSYPQGGAAPAAQAVAVSAAGSSQSFSASALSKVNWLSVNPLSGVTPATISISANPVGLAAGTYLGTVTVQESQLFGNMQQIPVSLTVGPALNISPAAAEINYQSGDPNPNSPTFSLSGAPASFTATASSTGNWLAVSPARGTVPGTLSAQITPAGLSAGLYTGTIRLLSGGSAQTITISLNLVSPQSLTLNPGSLTFTAQSGGGAPAAQNITVGCPNSALAFRPSASSVGNWLSVSVPSVQGNNQIIVSVNPAGLAPNAYAGTVTVFGVGACNTSQTVPVTLVIGASSSSALTSPGSTLPVTGPPTPSAAPLTFSAATLAFASGGTAPAPQMVSLTCAAAPAAFTATASSDQGWLLVTPLSGTTPGTLTISANPNGLAAGSYTGSVGASAGACGPAALAVTLTVTGGAGALATLAITPASLTFNSQPGGASPPSQTLSLTGAAGTAFTASSSNGWLSVSPASGSAPATLVVTVNPLGLLAGTYTSAITLVTGAAAGGSSQNISVTVTVPAASSGIATSPAPFLTSLVNAASMLVGPIAGGEIISIFGQGLGPAAGASLSLTPDGRVASLVAGTRLLIDGAPAPLLYTQQGQINAVVPYSVAGKKTVTVELDYQGTPSAPSKILVADAAPAIFTIDQSGQGQGAILDQDASVNSDLNPAAPGSIAVLYATGAGLLVPAGEDGAVTTQLAQTELPVSVLVDGENTEIIYAGPAPGLISGALQVNFRLPQDVTTGKAVGVLLKVGRFTSQPGVTLAIR